MVLKRTHKATMGLIREIVYFHRKKVVISIPDGYTCEEWDRACEKAEARSRHRDYVEKLPDIDHRFPYITHAVGEPRVGTLPSEMPYILKHTWEGYNVLLNVLARYRAAHAVMFPSKSQIKFIAEEIEEWSAITKESIDVLEAGFVRFKANLAEDMVCILQKFKTQDRPVDMNAVQEFLDICNSTYGQIVDEEKRNYIRWMKVFNGRCKAIRTGDKSLEEELVPQDLAWVEPFFVYLKRT